MRRDAPGTTAASQTRRNGADRYNPAGIRSLGGAAQRHSDPLAETPPTYVTGRMLKKTASPSAIPGVLNAQALALKAIGFAQRVGNSLKRRGWGSSSAGRLVIDALLWPSDAVIACRGYHRSFGSMPRLLRPQTFNEKLQHGKLFRRKRLHTVLADKIAVRSYVGERVGEAVLTRLYWTGVDLRSAPRDSLPQKFVIKANHTSGMNLIVEDRDALDWARAYRETDAWLHVDYSTCGAEYQYRWIAPRLLIEELLVDVHGGAPCDYKFFCLHGRVECVQIDLDRYTNHTRAFVDRGFGRMELGLLYPRYDAALVRPNCFEQMVDIAEKLSEGEPFARVDLYDVGRPVFGEITLHPGAGTEKFDPPGYDLTLGSRL
jgi:hypothetical protein